MYPKQSPRDCNQTKSKENIKFYKNIDFLLWNLFHVKEVTYVRIIN